MCVLQIDTLARTAAVRIARAHLKVQCDKVLFALPRPVTSAAVKFSVPIVNVIPCGRPTYSSRSVTGCDICRDTDIPTEIHSYIGEVHIHTHQPKNHPATYNLLYNIVGKYIRFEVNRVRYFCSFSTKTRRAKNLENAHAVSVSEV